MTLDELMALFRLELQKEIPTMYRKDATYIVEQPKSFKYLFYGLPKLSMLNKRLQDDRKRTVASEENLLDLFAARFVVDLNKTIFFAREGDPSYRIPAHSDMKTSVISAGNVYFSSQLIENEVVDVIHTLSNKTGHFKCTIGSLVWPLAILLFNQAPLTEELTLVLVKNSAENTSHVVEETLHVSVKQLRGLMYELFTEQALSQLTQEPVTEQALRQQIYELVTEEKFNELMHEFITEEKLRGIMHKLLTEQELKPLKDNNTKSKVIHSTKLRDGKGEDSQELDTDSSPLKEPRFPYRRSSEMGDYFGNLIPNSLCNRNEELVEDDSPYKFPYFEEPNRNHSLSRSSKRGLFDGFENDCVEDEQDNKENLSTNSKRGLFAADYESDNESEKGSPRNIASLKSSKQFFGSPNKSSFASTESGLIHTPVKNGMGRR